MSNRRNGELIITLKSDLCVGSGYSYAGIVDSDSCYDECGLPYIPAKRIKGCIRETLETTLYSIYSKEDIDNVFGRSGEDHSSSFVIGNAYIDDYEKIFEFLKNKKSAKKEGSAAFKPQEVLERFSSVIGQTKMENGVADKGSLRFTRAVNRFSPIDGKEMVFRASFSCNADDWELVSNGAKATRHIGLKRNRGLGNVKIEAVETKTEMSPEESHIYEENIGNGMIRLSFAVMNDQPLMLTKTADDESLDYIGGQQVLGVLSGRYLCEEGNSPEDEAFKELFLSGGTVFSNLYPTDGDYKYYPAPDYLRRRKKSKKFVYSVCDEIPAAEKEDPGDIPKKLKGKYVAEKDGGIGVLEVKKDVVYHHSHRNTNETSNNQEEGILYSVEVVRSRQIFSGTITVQEKYSALVKRLLCKEELYFGKSKIAQYGKCHIISQNKPIREKSSEIKAGSNIVLTFLSDAVFNDDSGNPTVFYDDVCDSVKKALNNSVEADVEHMISSIQTTMSTGYLSVWNLRRPAIPAIKAGSYLVFHVKEDIREIPEYIGERTLEGFGQISVKDASNLMGNEVQEQHGAADDTDEYQADDSVKAKINRLIMPVIYDQWLERKINAAISGVDKVDVSNTAAGRFTLMLRESTIEAAGNPALAFTKFGERIDSFKKGDTREKGNKILKKIGKSSDTEGWIFNYEAPYFASDKDLEDALSNLGTKDDNDEKLKRWPDYVMAILTDRKYKGR